MSAIVASPVDQAVLAVDLGFTVALIVFGVRQEGKPGDAPSLPSARPI